MGSGNYAFRVGLGVVALVVALPSFARPITFEERVRAQEAIERVYYSHQVGATKPFEEAVPRSLIENKVRTYLERTPAITPAALRSEADRIRTHSRMPERLSELFAALGDDPILIEDIIARQVLARGALPDDAAELGLPPKSFANDPPANVCSPDLWSIHLVSGEPLERRQHTAVWTGNAMLVWGGFNAQTPLSNGGRYDPALDSWQPIASSGAPSARGNHTAVWTGSKMIVWGGRDAVGAVNTGGRYDPIADSWSATSTINAPSARDSHSAVWTGSVMVIWGGYSRFDAGCNGMFRDGGRYDPATDSWSPTSLSGAPPVSRDWPTVWTGREMLIWGGETNSTLGHGLCGGNSSNVGYRYNPVSDSWKAMSVVDVPPSYPSGGKVSVWTGSLLIVWGDYNSGGRYDPAADAWIATRVAGAPTARFHARAVWTGSTMIVWGGTNSSGPLDSGGEYDPVADWWLPTTMVDAPAARDGHTAVWSGTEMLVFGGGTSGTELGGVSRYLPGNPDTDGDGVCDHQDNCPGLANPGQVDTDGDRFGDGCDNCASVFNRMQRDSDADGVGDLCDNCPAAANANQADTDGDGAGDVCDCQPGDPNNRNPAEVATLEVDKSATTANLTWGAVAAADAYAITRGDLSAMAPSHYGSCVADGLASPSYDDVDVPATSQGFFYLVQARNVICGRGSLGTTSTEQQRTNTDAGACPP
jgi:N-acetylneuraminic acid mutarotase